MYGRENYDGYRRQSEGKSLVSGEELPEWDALPGDIKAAWEAGGSAVYQAAEGDLEQI